MIFYLCNGDQLAGTQADARALDVNFKQVDVPTDKAGLMAYVNNLLQIAPAPAQPPPPPPQPTPNPTQESVDLDEVFDNLPLARQLHFAAIAMENARSRIKT